MGRGETTAAVHHMDSVVKHPEAKLHFPFFNIRFLIDRVRGIEDRVFLKRKVDLKEGTNSSDDGIDFLIIKNFLKVFSYFHPSRLEEGIHFILIIA